MSYNEFARKILKEDSGLQRITSVLEQIKGKKILVFSHDDPDGITSACIMKKIIEVNGGEPTFRFPDTYELEADRLKEAVSGGEYFAVFLLDKGTMGYYDEYNKIINNFFVIDHHFPQGSFKNIAVFNPALKKYEFCSCSFLMNIIAELIGIRDSHIDFLTLVGLKGDWAVEPATGFVSDYVAPYFAEVKENFAGLLSKIQDKPTMFEVVQRENTTLLNRIAEFVHAICGGGFQYFYNDREEALKELDHVRFTFDLLLKLGKKIDAVKTAPGFKEFTDLLPDKATAKKLFKYYEQDWVKSVGMMDSSIKIGQFNDTAIYFFLGKNVPLLPMVGSVKLYEITKANSDKFGLFVMVNHELSGGTHFSVRGTGTEVHTGKICGNLAKRLQELYDDRVNITGGGHPKAGECKTRKAKAPIARNLREFLAMFDEMYVLNEKQDLTEDEKKRAKDLGLEYK